MNTSPGPGYVSKDSLATAVRDIRRRRESLGRAEASAAAVELAQVVAAQAVAAQAIAGPLVAPHLARGAILGAYVPTRGEIDPLPLLARIRSRRVALPRIEGDNMVFRQINLPETTGSGPANSEWGWDRLGLREGPFEILEPPTTAPRLDLRAVSVLLVPLVAFDDECHRIGFGKGYYDRALGALPEGEHPILIGLAHAFQRLPRWLPDPWDVGLDMVATPAGVVLPGG